jgi:hypothetical protein
MNRSLVFSSIAFTTLWTLFMYLLGAPRAPAEIAMLIVAGLIAGFTWYVAMGWWMRPRTG